MQKKTEKPPVIIVAGIGKDNKAIGKGNGLLWHIPDDLKRFRALTMGHPIIMGRKTFESILEIIGKPFPGRENIVISRNKDYTYEGVHIVSSIEEALEYAQALNPAEIHIGGGAEIYKQVMPYVNKLYLTFYHDDKEGDAFFPPFEDEFKEIKRHGLRKHNGITYEWVDFERKK